MRLLFLSRLSQAITVLMFMAASVLPLYGQDSKTPQQQESVRSTSEQTSEDAKPSTANSSAESDKTQQLESSSTRTNQPTIQSYTFPTKRERFNRYVSNTVGPFSLLRTGLSAGIGQWRDNPEEWGQGASGFGKRYASSFGQNTIQQTVTYGLDEALGLDTGFRRSERKGFFPRLKHALAENVTSRTKSGKRVISAPRVAGVYTGAIIPSETWYPSRYSYKDGLRTGTYSLAAGFGINLVREFLVNW
jgi:hypothetical protein